ncbi:MAG: FAD-dependent oxidoreductase [Bacteroidota bacterium]
MRDLFSSISTIHRGLLHATLATVALLFFPAFHFTVTAQDLDHDILIIGGTPAGISAAIAAGRLGKTVLIIEQSPVLGGVLASGVLRLDDHIRQANSGIMEEFRQRVKAYHLSKLADDPLVKAHLQHPAPLSWNVAEGQAWEPHTAARIYAEMVAEIPGISTRFNEVAIDVILEGDQVIGVITQDRDNRGKLGKKHEYQAKVFIDATYEADLAAFAGVPFRIGREARSREEPHAGHIYTDGFGSKSGVLRGTIFPGGTGEADNRSQAFTFRMTGKDYGRPDHPFRLQKPPKDYDPAKYKWNQGQKPIIPNGKFDMLGINYGADLTGHSTDFVRADWKERAKIEEIFRNHSLGWLYYIQTEGGSPNVGLADDEFTDNGNFPYRLYVRQGLRIEGLYTLTESDLHKDLRGNGIRGPVHPTSIAIGMYPIDAHNVQGPTSRNAGPYGAGAAEGDIHLEDVTGPYTIPYGVMVPKNRRGVLFPVGISATHLAISSVRMEPVWSSLGQAAGVAAALSIDNKQGLKELNVEVIQDELLRQGSYLFFYKDLKSDASGFEAVQKLSLLGAVDGDENYYFRPDQPIHMGDFARMVVKGLDIPLSITAAHFEDVPRGHPAFKYIETLYDYSTQSSEPFFDYEIRNYLSYWWRNQSGVGPPVFAYPDHPVSAEKAVQIISGLLRKPIPAWQTSNPYLSRQEAARLVQQYILSDTKRVPSFKTQAKSDSTLKVLTYNIWNGFDWGKDSARRTQLQQWVQSQKPNVMALQELCNYTPQKLTEDARSWGHAYSVLLKTSGYSVGLSSTHPIELKEKMREGLHHGALHCKTQGIDFLVVHLHPGSIKRRREESRILLDKVKEINQSNPNVVVLGDFNAHSPFDASLYDPDGDFMSRLTNNNREKGLDGNLDHDRLDVAVMSSFLSIPLYDVVEKYSHGMQERGSFPGRVLGAVNDETDEELQARLERIDYIMVSASMRNKCLTAKVHNGEANWFLSDHYPVSAVFSRPD